MRINVPTIMHSGTHVLVNYLDRDKNQVDNFHCTVENRLEYDDYHNPNGLLVVSCLRHPRRIAASFEARLNDKSGLPGFNPTCTYTELVSQFTNLMSLKIDLWLHIDSDQRDDQAAAISQRVGKNLKTNWRVSTESGSLWGLHNIPIENCPEVNEKFIDFYYQTMKEK